MASGATGRARSAPRASRWPRCWPASTPTRSSPTRPLPTATRSGWWRGSWSPRDDGWIMRKAQFYRGAIQEEDEREGARAPVDGDGRPAGVERAALRRVAHRRAAAAAWRRRRLGAEGAQHGRGAGRPRPGLPGLRVKIHGSPGRPRRRTPCAPGPREPAHAAQREQALALAAEIDRVHAGVPMAQRLQAASRSLASVPGRLPSALAEAQQLYAAGASRRAAAASCRPNC